MPHELDNILISSSQPDFDDRIIKLRYSIKNLSTFPLDSKDYKLVRKIIEKIGRGDDGRGKGRDRIVSEYTEKFDKVKLPPQKFRVSIQELKNAYSEIEKNKPELLASIHQAVKNVKKYQTEIFIGNQKTHPGIRYTPIKRVGVCVPGASAPLPSTVIMCAVPAQVAGVKEIAVISPPRYKGSIHPVILAVCHELKIKEVYRIGGAQAIAALAFGTDSINRVNKIVGPGNQWVQTAKQIVFVGGYIGIDLIAGPSEVLIVANDKANPAWVAADMLSQAEHAPGSAVVYTDSQDFAQKILKELKKQVGQLNRKEAAIQCLLKSGAVVVFDKMGDVTDWATNFAAEHLEIHCGDESRDVASKIRNAGAIFIGDYSPVAVGDYWAGPSHTLPTGMTARFASGLSANDFIKSTSIIEYDKKKLAESAEDIIRLAEAEGLDAHAKSVRIRQQK